MKRWGPLLALLWLSGCATAERSVFEPDVAALNAMNSAIEVMTTISRIRNLPGATRLAKRAPISVPTQRPMTRLTIGLTVVMAGRLARSGPAW